MTSELFATWFELFIKKVTDRPLLLIYDVHLTHVTLQVIEKSRSEDITIVKLPPHTTTEEKHGRKTLTRRDQMRNLWSRSHEGQQLILQLMMKRAWKWWMIILILAVEVK